MYVCNEDIERGQFRPDIRGTDPTRELMGTHLPVLLALKAVRLALVVLLTKAAKRHPDP